jgi:nucleoside-diphosphate-sugar epimerase
MKVLLTGGSGNLGQTLVPRLLDRGDIPVILDLRAPRDLIITRCAARRSCRSAPTQGQPCFRRSQEISIARHTDRSFAE